MKLTDFHHNLRGGGNHHPLLQKRDFSGTEHLIDLENVIFQIAKSRFSQNVGKNADFSKQFQGFSSNARDLILF